MFLYNLLPSSVSREIAPNIFDVLAFILVVGAIILLLHGIHETTVSRDIIDINPISLNIGYLPEYALRTILRMLIAIVISLLFAFIYAALAAKSRRAEMFLIPVLDVMQSVPILGFLTFTLFFFMNLYPGRVLGAELAAIFAIFTSQVWNMTFSLYQSLRNIPKDLEEVSRSFCLSGWQKFWKLDVPFGMPGLVWNTMMSMSGSWFFVVASEMIAVGDTVISLPGIGSYVALAIKQKDLLAVFYAMLTMFLVIVLYDQLLFRPIVAWADKFRFERTTIVASSDSWVLDLFHKTKLLRFLGCNVWRIFLPFSNIFGKLFRILRKIQFFPTGHFKTLRYSQRVLCFLDIIWLLLIYFATICVAWKAFKYISANLSYNDFLNAVWLGCITMIRVVVLIIIATFIWVPIGVWIGLRPKISKRIQPLAQFLAAFPSNLFFPLVVSAVVYYNLNPDIWLSLLMMLGTQWYILFNVIAGASAFPNDLREAAKSFHVTGWCWWRSVILPGIFPYYVTGAVTACGGAWNASIISEVVSWGNIHLRASGLGAYIAQATEESNLPEVVLGIVVMCFFVLCLNRLLWRPLYVYSVRNLRFK
ncbi:ABC transporter permease subunit [Candidatus Liberibacter sp.]|uniref:ABC transporter permease n=1 Tax=Candidatus Liberibacter sp. TaxID=34022 RepID=UPI0015F630F3|nr:ABC transporter permease subunit [Candidatus Liberibacter sp.]MBA5723662.1 ABC transporter permease subunit [Candidatus Liberibacter sp.]